MKMKKRLLCALLALCMLLGGVAMGEPAGTSPVEGPAIYTHDGRVTLIDGACTDAPVNSMDDAAAVVDSVLDQLGGDADTDLDPWRDLTDAYGNHYYVFRQIFDNTTVLGGAVKVITDADGNMLGLTSSIEDNPAERTQSEGITAEKAEEIVLEHALSTQQQALNVVQGLTDRMILPVTLRLDMDGQETEESRYVWVVYTENPNSSVSRSSDLPYLAHYVTMGGEYLYSLPTIMPGDEAGASGFDASYTFEFMVPVDYTGYVDLSTGGEKEITVTLMQDKRTGMYYLGNIERRIVVADCWEFMYNGNRIVLNSSTDNREWDQVGLLSLYNYCRAYDYYKEIGWIGGDGLGTPILILNNFCDENHVPVDNAAYMGNFMGWQIFLSSRCNDMAQCLDVLAHEFTHCVTGSVMTYNAYMNDFGAINEAVSDIQGKTCEMIMEGRENVTWVLGDQGIMKVRDLAAPHHFNQPEFTWDIYYIPPVKTPSELNDRGGVHSDSSLLNRLAYLLYEQGGMTLEEGRAFWFTVDCAMVPGTDFAQLAELLPLALRIAGLEKYDADLRSALDAVRLGDDTIPDTMDESRALLTLELPDNKIFDDEQWVLSVYTVNTEKLFGTIQRIVGQVIAGDLSVLPGFVQEMMDEVNKAREEAAEAEKDGLSTLVDVAIRLVNSFTNAGEQLPEDQMQPNGLEHVRAELTEWIQDTFEDVFYSGNTNAGQDGRTMRMVCVPGTTIPMLMHGICNINTSTMEDACFLVYIGGTWIDLFGLAEQTGEGSEEMPPQMKEITDSLAEQIEGFDQIGDMLDAIFYRIEGGKQNHLPAANLDTIEPLKNEMPMGNPSTPEASEPKMSRPKLAADEGEGEVKEAA